MACPQCGKNHYLWPEACISQAANYHQIVCFGWATHAKGCLMARMREYVKQSVDERRFS